MISEAIGLPWRDLAVGLVLGLLLAVIYLAALARSVRGLPGARHPGRRLLAGSLLRLLLVGAGLGGLLAVGNALQVLAAVVGFMAMRTVVVRRQAAREGV